MSRPRFLLPVGIILIGALALVGMILIKPKTSRTPRPPEPIVVDVIDVALGTEPAIVRSTGTVVAAQEITLVPEVTGKIVKVSDNLIPGGRFNKGDTILRINSQDYYLALKSEESRVRQAELDLSLEAGRQEAAKVEWELLGDDRPESEAALALRKPQLEAAKVNLEAAKSSQQKAQLNLARTQLRAPFSCVVVEENVDVGQLVGPTTAVARLIGTDQFRVNASIPVDQLGLLQIPGFNAETGSPVKITQDLGGGEMIERQGRLIGLGGTLDPQTRTAQILVALDNPMDPPAGQSPIMHGAYVDIEIHGKQRPDVAIVPRKAVVDGKKVWVVDTDSKLASKTITIGWGLEDTVAVTDGLQAGDKVIVTKLALPIAGSPVKIADEQQEETETASPEGANES